MKPVKQAYPKKIEKLVGAALMRDAAYRSLLFSSPREAAEIAGVHLTERDLEKVAALLGSIEPSKFEEYAAGLHDLRPPSAVTW